MFDRLRLCSVPVYRGVWPQRWLKVQINASFDVNARQCSSATCKEDIFPNNKLIRAVLSANPWPSYVSLVTFRRVFLLGPTRGPCRDKTPQPALLPGGLSNALIYP